MSAARWSLLVGVALVALAVLLAVNRVRLAGKRPVAVDGPLAMTVTIRDQDGERTLLLVAGLAGALGVGLVLVGVAKGR
jgi:hypothetical protein